MNSTRSTPDQRPRSPWHEPLTRFGFAPAEDGYRFDGMLFKPDYSWLTVEEVHALPLSDRCQDRPDQPGLWKWIQEDGRVRRVFQFPAKAVAIEDEDLESGEPIPTLEKYLEWAVDSANNRIDPAWQPPSRSLVESWLPQGGLTVQNGSFVRQVELILAPARWALRIPIVPNLPHDLPAARENFLQEIATDAQDQWQMIRLSFITGSDTRALIAETDFSGGPHSERLFLAGLHGLRHVVNWLVETAEVLADVNVTSQALAVCQSQTP